MLGARTSRPHSVQATFLRKNDDLFSLLPLGEGRG
jgi:hypothetical protein